MSLTAPPGAFRTLHINTERTWRGGEKQALLLMQGLQARGHPVDLACPPASPLAERAAQSGLRVHEFSLRGEFNPAAIHRLRKLMRACRPHICHMHTSHAHTLGVLARGWRSLPRTVVSRRVDFSIYRKGALGLNWFKYRFGVDRYVAISHAIRDVLVRDGIPPGHIETVHSGVPPLPPARRAPQDLRAELGIPAHAPVIGNVAHLAVHKGQGVLLAAFRRLLDVVPDAHLVIVGEGEERAALEAAAREHALGERLHLTGFQGDVASYLGLFQVFCMPSLQEGLCTSLLDALHQPLPVVASRTGGIPEIIRHEQTGLLVTPAAPEELSAALVRLLQDATLSRRLAEAGQRLAQEEFSVDRMVEGNLRVYGCLLTGQAPVAETG